MKLATRLCRDERGVTAIEYCLLAALIALGIVTGVQEAGSDVSGSFEAAEAGFAPDEGDGPGKGKKKGKKKGGSQTAG